jgi:AcrR family transcriptional regulator
MASEETTEKAYAAEQAKANYHHGNLREALVETALDLLKRQGPASLGLRQVARSAGVSPSAPYHHFGSKEGLMAAVAAAGFRRLSEEQDVAQASVAGATEPDAQIRALGRSYIRFARANPELYRLMFGPLIEDRDGYPELTKGFEGAYRGIEVATEEYIVKHGDGGLSAKLAITGCWSMVHGLSNLLNDGKVVPGKDGLPDEEMLVEIMLTMWSRTMAAGPVSMP